MKKIFLISFLIIISSSNTAFSINVEQAMKACLNFKDNNYQATTDYGTILCGVTIANLIDYSNSICLFHEELKGYNSNKDGDIMATVYGVNIDNSPSVAAATRAFLNFAEANPDKWDMILAQTVPFWLSNNWPCEKN